LSRKNRLRGAAVCLSAIAILALPASGAIAGGPVAHKSGTLINFVTTGKLRVQANVQPVAVCTQACTVTGTGVIKGLGGKGSFSDNGGPFAAGQGFGLALKVKKVPGLFRAMKAFPGRFHLTETLTATPVDPATGAPNGAPESVTAGFKFKR
jgi:hypothetical protein